MPINIQETYPDGTFKATDRHGKTVYGYRIEIERRTYKRSGFPTRKLAQEARASRKLKRILEDHGLGQSIKVRLSELKDAWVADAREREIHPTHIRHGEFLMRELIAVCRADIRLDELTAQHIRAFKNRRAEAVEVGTLITNLSLVKTILRAAPVLFPGLRFTPPVIRIPPPEKDSRGVVVSPAQIDALRSYLNGPAGAANLEESHSLARDYLTIALHSLRRESEILTLTKQQVDFTPGPDSPYGRVSYLLRKKKKQHGPRARNKSLTIPMTADVFNILRRRCDEAKSDNLFGDKTLAAKVAVLRRGFYRACKAVGITSGYKAGGVVIHTLRHSAATYLMSGAVGLPLPVVQAILGHSSGGMTLKYAHAAPQDMRGAMEALASLGNGTGTATDTISLISPICTDDAIEQAS